MTQNPTQPTYSNDRKQLRILSFESFRKAMLFAGIDRQGKFDNWNLAHKFAEQNGMYPVFKTEGGVFLDIPDRRFIEGYSDTDLKKIWISSSIRYCLNIDGSIKTFVCGATSESIFRSKEIQAVLRAKCVEDINGYPLSYYQSIRTDTIKRLRGNNKHLPRDEQLSGREIHHAAITAVFIAIGENEVAQDFKIACDVGDENEKKAVLSRLDHMQGQLVKEDGERLKRKFDKSSGIPSNDNDSTIMDEMYRANSIHNVAGVLKFG